ncbi:MAG: inositol monophosphatase [Betaproteobacteria bacterium]
MADTHLTDRYDAARWIAREAGQLALDYFRNRERLTVEMKGPADYVSHADRDVENVIRRELKSMFPDDAFLGEETAAQFTGPVDRCWVVDPIDGTHNFLRGIPYWNVAIGYVENGRTQVGVVYDPPADELFHALRGGGAWCQSAAGESRLQAAPTAELAGSYVVLGHHDRSFDARYFDIRRRMMEAGVAMRNFGSAALQLAHVASGRLDGFIELQLSAWDAIAGLLLVEEAGGYQAPFMPASPTAKALCVAGAPGIGAALAALVIA